MRRLRWLLFLPLLASSCQCPVTEFGKSCDRPELDADDDADDCPEEELGTPFWCRPISADPNEPGLCVPQSCADGTLYIRRPWQLPGLVDLWNAHPEGRCFDEIVVLPEAAQQDVEGPDGELRAGEINLGGLAHIAGNLVVHIDSRRRLVSHVVGDWLTTVEGQVIITDPGLNDGSALQVGGDGLVSVSFERLEQLGPLPGAARSSAPRPSSWRASASRRCRCPG
jgi:hypothetical protein